MIRIRQWRRQLRHLYDGRSQASRWFNYSLLALDLVALAFIIVTSFLSRNSFIRALDIVFGVAFLIEFLARFAAARRPLKEALRFTTLTDIVAIGSLLAAVSGEGAGFLRSLRTLRMLHTFRVLKHLRNDSQFFMRHEEVIVAIANLSIFVFVMTGIVYETQHYSNPSISNYVDALYFTVTALTTTGFGDITLSGSLGRLTTVVIMIFGVTLFLNLARVLFSPTKVRFSCPDCGLQRHDRDAVHCKACGRLLNIPDEGLG